MICVLVGLLLVCLPLAVPAQAPGPTVRVTVNEVLLDVVVRDKKGKLVRDLRPEEIQVFEDGVAQKIGHFELFDGRASKQPGPPTVATAPAVTTPTAAGTPLPTHTVTELRDITVVSVVVESSLEAEGRTWALKGVREFIKNELTPKTYVGVFSLGYGYIRAVQPYTNDAEKIYAGMEQAVTMTGVDPAMPANRAPVYNAYSAIAEEQALLGASNRGGGSGPEAEIAAMMETHWITELHDVYTSSMAQLTALRRLVQSQEAIPGRKVVLLFSPGLNVHPDTVEVLKSSISAANRANVTIYAMATREYVSGIAEQPTKSGYRRDPGAPVEESEMARSKQLLDAATRASMKQQMEVGSGGQQEVTPDQVVALNMAEASIHADTRGNLAVLAEGTGGALLPNMHDLREPLRRAMEEVRTHYELSYSPANPETDGSFRKITVKVSRPGVSVFSRSGYYALPLVNGREVYPFEMATMKAINTKPPLQQFDFHATALRFRAGPEKSEFAFAFQVASRDLAIVREKETVQVHVAVTALIKDEKGQVVEKISKDIPYQFPAAKLPEIQRAVVSFTAPFLVPPGRYTIETAALDRESMKVSVHRLELVAEGGSGLAMSDVTLVRRVDAIQGQRNAADPLQAHGGKVEPELSDVVVLAADEPVRFYTVAYAPGPVEMALEISRNGNIVVGSPSTVVHMDKSGTAAVLASVPAGKLSTGTYQARLTFRYGDQMVANEKVFTVQRGK